VVAWLVRLIFIPAGAIAGWFVAKDAPNFGAVQLMVGLLLLLFIVATLILGSYLQGLWRDRHGGPTTDS
jgi:hypothetical protein